MNQTKYGWTGMNRQRALGALAVVIVMFLAGCSSKDKNLAALAPGTLAPAPEVDASSGAIHGVVTDESSLVLSGVKVGLVELKTEVVSDENGQFTFSKLQPGFLRVSAHKLGYKDWLRNVEIRAGEISNVNIQLTEIPIEDSRPRSEMQIFNGRIVCGTGNPVFVEVICGDPLDPVAPNTNQKFLFKFNISKEETGQLWEQSWKPTQLLSRDLLFIVEKDCGDNSCPTGERFAQTSGCCYLRIALNDTQLDIPAVKAGSKGATIRSRTFPAGGTVERPVNVFTDQSFTIYWEKFWGPLPENFKKERTNVPPT